MIKSALFALGMGLGAIMAFMAPSSAARAQGASDAGLCGGVAFTLTPQRTATATELASATQIVKFRMGELFGRWFDGAVVVGGDIVVTVPQGTVTPEQLASVVQRGSLSFHTIYTDIDTGRAVTLPTGQRIVVDGADASVSFILETAPILGNDAIVAAQPMMDAANRPAVAFKFSDPARATFAQYTSHHIGDRFAIVLNDVVLSAPRIMGAIDGGQGILTGDFTPEEAARIAVALRGGVLPFDLDITDRVQVDGSDPSDDFCP